MNDGGCERVIDVVGVDALSPVLAKHVEGCAFCRGARAAYEAMEPAAAHEPSLDAAKVRAIRQKALSELAKNPKATPWWLEALVLVLVNVFVAGGGALLLTRNDDGIRNGAAPSMLVLVSMLLLAVLLAGAFLAVAPGAKLFRNVLLALGLGVSVAVGMAGSGIANDTRGFLEGGMPCMTVELAMSVVPVAFALWLISRSAFQPGRALLVGLSGGAAGMIALHLHCPNGTVGHLFAFHVLPYLALAGIALLVRRKLPTRSYAP